MSETIYTVPLHVGQNVEVPKGSLVTFYDPLDRQQCLDCKVEMRRTRQDDRWRNEDGSFHICPKK